MGSPTRAAGTAVANNLSRVDRITKLPYKPANVKLADVKKAVNAVIRERGVRKDSK